MIYPNRSKVDPNHNFIQFIMPNDGAIVDFLAQLDPDRLDRIVNMANNKQSQAFEVSEIPSQSTGTN